MECSLLALLTCFSWSNLYIDGGISVQDRELPHQVFDTQVFRSPSVIETIITQRITDEPMNPYGRIALGYEVQLRSVSFALEFSHRSSLDTGDDRGVQALSLKARWYPFRR